MASKGKDSYTLVEFGSSKISVLFGGRDSGGAPSVFGFGSRDSAGAVVKGEIVDIKAAADALGGALEDAENSAGGSFDRNRVFFLVSGKGIVSRQGEGSIMIYDADRKVTEKHVQEAIDKALRISPAPDQMHLESFTSYFMLDMNTRVKDPEGHSAERLDAFIHIILAARNRVETMRSVIHEFGFEKDIIPVFSGIASAYGVLTHDEKEQGTLLMDFGAGTLDYVFVQDEGVMMSGVLPIGFENIVNDLAVGLELTQDQARKILVEDKLDELISRGEPFYQLPIASNAVRNIPIGSIEKIFELRVNEIFDIILQELTEKKLNFLMKGGAVLTGGGALSPMVCRCAENILRTHVRCGEPLKFSGVSTGLYNPRYAALLGVLNYVLQLETGTEAALGLGKVADALEGIGGFFSKLKDATRTWKI